MDTVPKALVGGLAGAGATTLLNETARRLVPNAPRIDVVGQALRTRAAAPAPPEPMEREEYGL